MIKNIYVKNFVLIDELHLDFHSSFSGFTGETGAGKSLFIDALSILCGARVNAGYIQKGADSAFIEAVIEFKPDHPALKVLAAAGYALEDDYIVVSREFTLDGKSSTRLNNRITTVAFIRELLKDVIDIHSQHDSQYLLNNKNHLSLLDSYTNDSSLLEAVKSAYRLYHDLQKELDLMMKEEFNADDLDFYQYQLQEIEKINIKEGEIEALEQTQKEMQSFEKTSTLLQDAIHLIDSSKYENIYELHKDLDAIDNATIQKVKEELLNAYYLIDENSKILKQYTNALEYDENVFNEVQERLFEIQKIIRKHGHTYEDLLQKTAVLETKIASMSDRDLVIATREKAIHEAYLIFKEQATLLSEKRKQAAINLEREIKRELSDLHLENATFKVVFEAKDSSMGIDQVEFYIAMNKGEDIKPLAKVISGGELSRLMLGLKAIFSKLQHIQTIIFDEIDTGVSGSVAYAIGKKMKKLSRDAQVFSITHLAPVAAWGDYHYLVEKKEKNGHTISSIRLLNESERIAELASIASNSNSKQALEAAVELYQTCRNDTI